jgi:hypothetical protein
VAGTAIRTEAGCGPRIEDLVAWGCWGKVDCFVEEGQDAVIDCTLNVGQSEDGEGLGDIFLKLRY